MTDKFPLPIDPYLPELREAVANYSTVLVKASPGSGKTTRLPWYLAHGLNKRVVVLEPRRLAAKLAAQRIATEENLTLGKEVGYQFRFEKKTSEDTSLIFYTEGTFIRKFLQDQNLKDVDVVILDEFHERHLDTDLALSLLRNLQSKRPELKIILMSATLDTKLVEFFPNSKVIEIEAPMYPIEIHYLPNQPSVLNQSLESKVKKAIESYQGEGDILVFLPGMREMLKVKETLNGDVFLLHADLTKEEQDAAVSLSKKQKIILATNIAESSVTIPGVRLVIDSGIQREAYYSSWNGLKSIQDVPVTKSSAIQRAGRAGRTAPGQCIRLYSQQDFNERVEFTIPELFKADLTDTFLMVKGTGLTPEWFQVPPQDKWEKAKELCFKMGAIDQNSELTNMGKKFFQYPLDARLTRIMIEGENYTQENKKNLLRYICREIEDDKGPLFERLSYYLKTSGHNASSWEKCVLTGFIDQVARYRSKQRDFVHYSGKTLKAHHLHQDLMDGFYLILDITQKQEAYKILSIEEEWLWDITPFPFTEEDEIKMDEKITLRRKTKLGSLVVEEEQKKINWGDLSEESKNKIETLSLSRMNSIIQDFKNDTYY